MNERELPHWLDAKVRELQYSLDKEREAVTKTLYYLEALRTGTLTFSAEPVIHIASGAVLYQEYLMRLQDANGNNLSTVEVLSHLDTSNVMPMVAEYLVGRALLQAIMYKYPVGINIPPQLFMAENFRKNLSELLIEAKDDGLNPELVYLEVLETPSLNISDAMQPMFDWMADISAQGYSIGLDDFGATDSQHTLEHIQKLPIQFLKLDGSVVDKMLAGTFDESDYLDVFNYCTDQNIPIIAEHVDTPEKARQLQARYPCVTHVQSYKLRPEDFH